jgi:signal transduction histidine kinase
LNSLAAMLGESMSQVRGATGHADDIFPVSEFIADAARSASYHAAARGCAFTISPVDPFLGIAGDRSRLLGALANLLQNAFKFTHSGTEVALTTRAEGSRILIELSDHCGGLPCGAIQEMFRPFSQSGEDRSGLGLGLSIARRGIEADGGTLEVRDVPGTGCVFTIDLPQRALH